METKPEIDLQGITKDVAKFLPGWSWESPTADRTNWHAILRHTDGMEIYINGNGWTRDGRLHIGCSGWPKTKKGDECSPYKVYCENKAPSITVADNRPPKAIAAEITRRILPEFLPLYQKMLEYRDATDRRQESAKEKCAELTRIVGGETRGLEAGDGEVHWYHEEKTYGDAKPHSGGKEWTLSVHNLPYEKVAKILKIVKE